MSANTSTSVLQNIDKKDNINLHLLIPAQFPRAFGIVKSLALDSGMGIIHELGNGTKDHSSKKECKKCQINFHLSTIKDPGLPKGPELVGKHVEFDSSVYATAENAFTFYAQNITTIKKLDYGRGGFSFYSRPAPISPIPATPLPSSAPAAAVAPIPRTPNQ